MRQSGSSRNSNKARAPKATPTSTAVVPVRDAHATATAFALAAPEAAGPDAILDLQRQSGNHAVAGMLTGLPVQRHTGTGKVHPHPHKPPPLPKRPPPLPPRKAPVVYDKASFHADAQAKQSDLTTLMNQAVRQTNALVKALSDPARQPLQGITDTVTDDLIAEVVQPLIVEGGKTVLLPLLGKSSIPAVRAARTEAMTKAASVAQSLAQQRKIELRSNALAPTATKREQAGRMFQEARLSTDRIAKTQGNLADSLLAGAEGAAADKVIAQKGFGPSGLFQTIVEQARGPVRQAVQSASGGSAFTEADDATMSAFQAVADEIRSASSTATAILQASTITAAHALLAKEVQEKVDAVRAMLASMDAQVTAAVTPRFEAAAKTGAKDAAGAAGAAAAEKAIKVLKVHKGARDEMKKSISGLAVEILKADPTSSQELQDMKASVTAQSVSAVLDDPGSLNSKLAVLGKLIDAAAPKPGDKSEVDVLLKVPVPPQAPVGFVGFHFTGSAEKDQDLGALKPTTKGRLDLTVVGGGELPGVEVMGEAGGYMEAASTEGGAGVMNMISYGLYRRFKESDAIPREISNALWGLGGATAKVGETASAAKEREAATWASAVEESMGDDESFESGAKLAAGAKAGGVKDTANIEGSLTFLTGKKYTKKGIEEARAAGLGKKAAILGGFFGGRGGETSVGTGVNSLELKMGAGAGPLAGEASGKLSFQLDPGKLFGFEGGGNFSMTAPSGAAKNGAETAAKIATGLGQAGSTLRKIVEGASEMARRRAGTQGKNGAELVGLGASFANDAAGLPGWFSDKGEAFGTAYLTKISEKTVGESGAVKRFLPGEAARTKYLEDSSTDHFGKGDATSKAKLLNSSVKLKMGPSASWDPDKGWRIFASLDIDKGLSAGLPKLIEAKLTKSERILKAQLWPTLAWM